MMYYLKKIKHAFVDYFYDHYIQKEILLNVFYIFITALSGFIFAFGYKAFIQPNYNAVSGILGADVVNNIGVKTLASCGASGICQIIIQIMKLCGATFLIDNTYFNIIYWGLYLVLNTPLVIMAWFSLGKRLAIYTLLNVAFASLFGMILPTSSADSIVVQITAALGTDIFARVVFGGICTGLAGGLAYLIGSTAGGTDVIAYYLGEKKRTLVGKWSALINLVIVFVYLMVSTVPVSDVFVKNNMGNITFVNAIVIYMFLLIYMFVVAFVVDKINIENKKVELQIATKNTNVSKAIMANVPHSCTIIKGFGGFSGDEIYTIYMTVRKKEARKVIKIAKAVDNSAFISEIPLDQVYGRFYRKPIKWF